MVTTIVNDPSQTAGQAVDASGAVCFRGSKAAGITIARGDIVVKDTGTAPDSYKTNAAGAAIPGPFYIATQAAASADTKVSLAVGGLWMVTGDDTIEPGDAVMLSTTTAGRVMKSTAVTTVPIGEAVVGVSMGMVESYGTGAPLASTVGDLLVIDLDGGNRG
jgi:hypothetical protein